MFGFGHNLHPKDDWANAIIDWYYHWLDSDPDFVAELAELFQRLDELAPRFERLAEETRQEKTIGYGQPCNPLDPDWPEDTPFLKAIGDYRRARYQIERMLLTFAERWHLPQEHALLDLWHSHGIYGLARGIKGKAKWRLICGPRVGWVPTVGIPVEIGGFEADGVRIRVVQNFPVIYPNLPLPFLYDPIEQDRKWLNERIDAICADIRKSILQQAEEYERQAKEAGWREKPKRWAPDYLERIARAVYLRAIKRQSWEMIMKDYDPDLNDVPRFADRIRRYAEDVGIAL